jgi:hypothetical protein
MLLRACEAISDVILRSGVFAASRRMAARTALNNILRGSPRGSHLRMTFEIASYHTTLG